MARNQGRSVDRSMSVADVEPVVVRHIVAELRLRGLRPTSLLAGLGITEESLADSESCVSYAQTSQVIRRAVRMLHSPNLGLHLGATVNLVSWGMCLIGLMACANSHDMLEFAAEFHPSTGRLLRLRFEQTPDGPIIVGQARFDEPMVTDFLVEKTFASFARACRSIVGSDHGPTRIDLAMSRPADIAAHSKVFNCGVHFEQPLNRMHFSAASVPIISADAVITDMARRLLTAKISSPSHEVESVVVQAISSRLHSAPTLLDIAESINLSERTLRRRLASLGLSYAGLLDRERRDQALGLIRSRRHSMQQIAEQTGFVDASNLRRAVKRWTGLTPSALRGQTQGTF